MAPISEERKAKRKARRRVKRREVAVEREMQLQAELENAQAKLAEKEKELEDSRLAIMLKEREIDNMRFTLAIQPFMPKLPRIDLTDLADPANGQSCLGEGSFGKVYLKRLRSKLTVVFISFCGKEFLDSSGSDVPFYATLKAIYTVSINNTVNRTK